MLPQPGRAVTSPRDSGPSWWQLPSEAGARLPRLEAARVPPQTFRLGDGFLVLQSGEPSLRERFADLFGDCAEQPAGTPPGLTVRCTVEASKGSLVVRATFEDPEPLDVVDFCRALFEDRGYREVTGSPAPWRLLASAEEPGQPLMAASGEICLFDARDEWQPLLGNLALNRVLRLQREVIFVHAASISVGGRGVLLPGGKGSGKTTLSLALASRGHGFLGDEIGAVRTSDWSLLPVRRALSVRRGPSAARVREAIESGVFHHEELPDGSVRTRARIGEIFPGSTAVSAPFRAIFFLGGRRARAECVRLRPRPSEIGRLPLSPATLWEVPPPRRYLALMRLLGQAACFDLHPGDPDETADLVERTMETL